MSETYFAAYTQGKEKLCASGVPEYELDARLLLEAVCHTTRQTLYADAERPLSGEESASYAALIERRCLREPVAYLLGEQEFMGLSFLVTRDVLIPRQDTETLVETAMRLIFDNMCFLDLCTGTGCMALSLLRYTNDTHATATDISEKALSVALENAKRLELSSRFTPVRCDLFPPLAHRPEKGYDLVMANPPYIPSDVMETLAPEVRDYEPVQALCGGADGLMFYRRIAEGATRFLARGAYLILEIGHDQKDAVQALLSDAGYDHIDCVRDAAGNDRVLSCTYRGSHDV